MARLNANDYEIKTIHEKDRTVLVPVVGQLGTDAFVFLVKRCDGVLNKEHGRVVIDFRMVKQLSFAACAFLVYMKKLADEAGGALAVENIPERLKAEIELYHLDDLLSKPAA